MLLASPLAVADTVAEFPTVAADPPAGDCASGDDGGPDVVGVPADTVFMSPFLLVAASAQLCKLPLPVQKILLVEHFCKDFFARGLELMLKENKTNISCNFLGYFGVFYMYLALLHELCFRDCKKVSG